MASSYSQSIQRRKTGLILPIGGFPIGTPVQTSYAAGETCNGGTIPADAPTIRLTKQTFVLPRRAMLGSVRTETITECCTATGDPVETDCCPSDDVPRRLQIDLYTGGVWVDVGFADYDSGEGWWTGLILDFPQWRVWLRCNGTDWEIASCDEDMDGEPSAWSDATTTQCTPTFLAQRDLDQASDLECFNSGLKLRFRTTDETTPGVTSTDLQKRTIIVPRKSLPFGERTCVEPVCASTECISCEDDVAPQQFSFTIGSLTNLDGNCDCPLLAATELTISKLPVALGCNDFTDACEWRINTYDPQMEIGGCELQVFFCVGVTGGSYVARLTISYSPTGVGGDGFEYRYSSVTPIDCLNDIVLTLVPGAETRCTNWPASITLSPV
jgi:hypothetical protein